jgi:hypothetical protein
MALPNKGLRKITIGKSRFAWSATGNDGWISLTIAPLNNLGQLVTTAFSYHSKATSITQTLDGRQIIHAKQQLIITPYIVRQVIEYALQEGWNPQEKGPQFVLHNMEGKIDLRLIN